MALDRWWEGLDDPTLDQLADRGLAQNSTSPPRSSASTRPSAALRATGAAALVSGGVAAETEPGEGQSGSIDTQSPDRRTPIW